MDRSPIKVLLADDHPLVRAGIRATLCGEPDLVLVGEADNGRDARRFAEDLRPDVLLLDLSMPGGPAAVETVAYLRENCPEVRVVILTAYYDDAYIRGLIQAGVAGYILKDEVPEAVVRALHAVAQGGTWFSRSMVAKLVHDSVSTADESMGEPRLTERERQILHLVAAGQTDREIGQTLNIAERTVRYTLRNLYDKLGVSSRAEAAYRASQLGDNY